MGSIKCSRDASFSFFFIFFVVSGFAFGTRFWFKSESVHGGLWQVCFEIGDYTDCETTGFDESSNEPLFIGAQIAMGVAVVCYLISFICYCVWVSKSRQFLEENGAGSAGKTALAFELIGGLCNVAAVAQYGAKFTDGDAGKLNYSYYLAVSSCVVMTLNSIITLGTTACCFTPQQERSVVMSTTITPHYGEVTIMTSETSYKPITDYPVGQSYVHPNTGPHVNQGYAPELKSDYNMIQQYPSQPKPEYTALIYPKLPEPTPDYSTHM